MTLTILLTLFMLLVLYFDARHYIIPNWLVGSVLALYPAFLFLSPEVVDWQAGLLTGLIAFVVGFLLFNFNIMGGGDVKLLAVCFLWVAPKATVDYFVYTGLLGGGLALVLIIARPVISFYISKFRSEASVPRVFTHGEPLPYGIAIGLAFIIVLWKGSIAGLPSPL